jgi:hypothetical protein
VRAESACAGFESRSCPGVDSVQRISEPLPKSPWVKKGRIDNPAPFSLQE